MLPVWGIRMTERKYNTNASLERRDGQLAMSPAGRSFADSRTNTSGNRIAKLIGKKPPFSAPFIEALTADFQNILERPHLVKELSAAKKIMNALAKVPDDIHAQEILAKMQVDPRTPGNANVRLTCPFWRHDHELEMTEAAMGRYVFNRVRTELYLVTIIFSFAENLEQLSEDYVAAHAVMKDVVNDMTKKRKGVVIIGSFEPDLESVEELLMSPNRLKMLKQFGQSIPDTGGWTLTGHFFVRVPHEEILKDVLNQRLPGKGWARVQFDKIAGHGTLEAHLMKILGYAGKYPKPLFEPPTRGNRKHQADKDINALRTAFAGPELKTIQIQEQSFSLRDAIVQWTKFIDRMGLGLIYYSVESVHAQKWYSDSEMDYIRHSDLDMYANDNHRIEMHRDTGPFQERVVIPRLKGRARSLRSRPLIRDHEWEKMTDCSNADPMVFKHDLLRWMFKP